LSQPDHETDGQNGPEIFPNYEADRAIPFLRESFVLMHDSEACAQQMLDDAFGDLLGFLRQFRRPDDSFGNRKSRTR
jgi:hypothetical protein